MNKTILDPCCGGKMFWFNHNNPNVVFCDNRKLDKYKIYKDQVFEISPDIQCDFCDLPFPDESFWHIVFDPPHLTYIKNNSWLGQKYGKLPQNWRQVIHDGFNECWRVLKPNGTLIFKWSSVEIPLSELLKVIDHEPLYGHKSGKRMNTHWLAFYKEA